MGSAVPANDGAAKCIEEIMELVTAQIAVGLSERKAGKDKAKAEAATKKADKPAEKVEATKEDAKAESK